MTRNEKWKKHKQTKYAYPTDPKKKKKNKKGVDKQKAETAQRWPKHWLEEERPNFEICG